MILSFDDTTTEAVFNGFPVALLRRIPPEVVSRTQKKLDSLNVASNLNDLAATPGNRLEALRGDRNGQWSIRVNDQWRLIFRWDGEHAANVSLVDYQ